ncbi:MAG: S9 family peptidase [Oligoflexia bacterium]|nr:S9 family peptidase [Oligoflexia bacterium]
MFPLILLLISVMFFPYSNSHAEYAGHGIESVDADTIKKFAPLPLETTIAKKIQNMLDIRAPGMGLVSPDSKKLFFTWKITGSYQVWRLDSPLAFPVQLTAGEDHTRIEDITADGKYLILSRDQNGEENPGIYLQAVTGGPLQLVQHIPKIKTRFEFVTSDSKYIYFTSNQIDEKSYALYRYEISTRKKELLFDNPGIWSVSDFLDDGTILLTKYTGSRWREHYLWNNNDKKLQSIIGENEKEEYQIRFAKKNNKNEFIILTPKFSEFKKLYNYDFKKNKFTQISKDKSMDVSHFQIDEAREHIYYYFNDNGFTRPEVLNAQNFKTQKIPVFPNADHVYFGMATRDGRFVTIGIETAKSPRLSYVYDWKKKHLKQWLLPSIPEVDLSKFKKAALEFYPARDGTKIPMLVRRPSECEKDLCPVVVHFHGGPEGQSRPGFSTFAQMFVDSGFIFVEPNVRGSEGYGKSWLEADNGSKRINVITDIEDCAKFIRSNWKKNEQTPFIGVFGGSYGGYLTMMAMTMFAGSYDAGVEIVGMSDLITFLKNTAPYRRPLRIDEYGDPEKDQEILKKLSPINYLEQIKGPLLLIQGVNDPRVPAGEAIQIYDSLKKKDIDVNLILFADEGHGTSKRSNQVLEIGHTIQFFKKTLTKKK